MRTYPAASIPPGVGKLVMCLVLPDLLALTGPLLLPVCDCSLVPSTLAAAPQQQASHRAVHSTFRAEGSSAAVHVECAAVGGEGTRPSRGLYVRANEPFARGVGNPASHILL